MNFLPLGIPPPISSTTSRNDEKRDLVITTNSLDEYHVRLFLLLGGLDINKMKPLTKMMMKLSIKMAIKKDPSQKEMLEQRLNGSLNFVSNSNFNITQMHKVMESLKYKSNSIRKFNVIANDLTNIKDKSKEQTDFERL